MIKYFACNGLASREAAPRSPISSSTVMTTSKAGCFKVGSSRRARPYATAIPLSPPRVVPCAKISSPSMPSFKGSFVKSWVTSGFFSHTISI
ncbi:hypothetical protein EVA_18024 [gut metagenome]|uniref:Uncharacterized protein n=1 Tax=gut metagenome TaxID=749906 RepID=J9G2S2_9ZZZZ